MEIFATTAEVQPAGAELSKARLNRFRRCSPREQNPGYSKYHWWNSKVNICGELSFRHANLAIVFTGKRGNLAGMNRPSARDLGFAALTGTDYSAGLGRIPYRDGNYEYYVHEKVGPDDPKGIGAFLWQVPKWNKPARSR